MASANIGGVETAGEPVEYFWNPLNNMVGLLVWLILAAGFALFKENRCRQALWILLPVVLTQALWAALAAAFDIPSSQAVVFTAMLDTLLISFALIWMLAERLGRFNRFVRLLLETGILCVIGAASLSRVGFGFESVIVAVLCIVTWSVALSSLSFARLMCRRHFGAIRFCLWAGVWILVTTPLLLTAVAAVQMRNLSYLAQYLLQVLTISLIFAGVLIAGLLPFEILLFVNSFWRSRFEKLYRPGTRAAATGSPEPAQKQAAAGETKEATCD